MTLRVCLCKEFRHQGHEVEENGPRKSLFSPFGLKDVAQRRWSRTSEEAEQIRNHQINTSDTVECMSDGKGGAGGFRITVWFDAWC